MVGEVISDFHLLNESCQFTQMTAVGVNNWILGFVFTNSTRGYARPTVRLLYPYLGKGKVKGKAKCISIGKKAPYHFHYPGKDKISQWLW